MEKYGDLITNGLDLISFLLVTPEILRLIAPHMNFLSKAVALMLGLPVAAAFLVATLLIVLHQTGADVSTGWKLPGSVLLVIALIALIPPEVAFPPIRWIYQRGSKHLFALGIVLFIVSRLIAIYGAALKSDLLPPWATL